MADILTEPQRQARVQERAAAVAKLKHLLSSTDTGRLAGQQLIQGGEHTEACLLGEMLFTRWLRARDWDVEVAFQAILKHAEWRAAQMPAGKINKADIANELACEKVILQGLDRHSRPILIVQVSKHSAWTRSLPELERLCCYALDACIAQAPLDQNPGARITVVMDLTGLGMSNMDIQGVKTLLQLLQQHYVERLGALFFCNPSTIFWGTWRALSPLLPGPTRDKIKIVDPTDSSLLLEDITPEVLPVQLGGKAQLAPPLT